MYNMDSADPGDGIATTECYQIKVKEHDDQTNNNL